MLCFVCVHVLYHVFFFSFFQGHVVRLEVCVDVRFVVFTVAILAQGTNRGDALCAALLLNRGVSNLGEVMFSFILLACSSLLFFFASHSSLLSFSRRAVFHAAHDTRVAR